MGELPTIQDVASIAGVSRQTVSNVLNAPDVVRLSTRLKVEAVIADLGYRPHASARRLRTRKSSTIGIRLDPMTDGISGSVLDQFLHALTDQAASRGQRILLFTATDPEDEIRQYARLREGADVDSFVLTSTFHGDPRTEWLIEHGQDFVTFGRPWGIDDMDDPAHPWVDVDGWWGVREATLETLRMLPAGSRRVAFIGWPSPSGTGDERRRGWREAMLEASGLDASALEGLERAVEDGVASGGAAMGSLGDAGQVDAVVCASDALALGALIATEGRLPVVGYDDTPVARALGMSSVTQPLADAASGVLDLLLNQNAEPPHRLVRPTFVARTLESLLRA